MNGNLAKYFSDSENELLAKLDTPEKIQEFIDSEITYDPYREDRSIKQVLEDRKAECYNGALLAVCCLLNSGYEASLIELLAKDDEEHILCVYKKGNHYGSIAQSKFLGLKSRNPIYKSVHDLAVSYKEFYFAFDGRYSLTSYTDLFDLSEYDLKWLTDPECVKKMAVDIRNVEHINILDESEPVCYASPDRYWREVLVIPKEAVVPDVYLAKKPK